MSDESNHNLAPHYCFAPLGVAAIIFFLLSSSVLYHFDSHLSYHDRLPKTGEAVTVLKPEPFQMDGKTYC